MGYALSFNGVNSKVDCGGYDDLTGDKTFVAWVNARSFGSHALGLGTILYNGKLVLRLYNDVGGVAKVSFSSSLTNFVYNDLLFGDLNTWNLVVITRTAAGITNYYFNGGLVGTANQDSGTPAAGTVNIHIGARDDGTRVHDGLLGPVKIIDGLLTAQEVNQLWTSEKHKYNL